MTKCPHSEGKNEHTMWISSDEANRLANQLSISSSQFDALYADVVVMDAKEHLFLEENQNISQEEDSVTTTVIRRVKGYDFPSSFEIQPIMNQNLFVEAANFAAESTCRWCDLFVAELGLCPWARASLNSKNAVRIKILPLYDTSNGDDLLQRMDEVVRESSEQFLRSIGSITWDKDDSYEMDETKIHTFIDPNVAITFVIAVPFPSSFSSMNKNQKNSLSACQSHKQYSSELSSILPPEFDFLNFVEFFNDLDDELYYEAEEFDLEKEQEQKSGNKEEQSNVPLGKSITLAPFHPLWRFAPSDNENEGNFDDQNNIEQSIDFEKRSPYPTISIVLTKAITNAGAEMATDRIGMHNQAVLDQIKVDDLQKLFLQKVVKDPVESMTS